MIHKINLSFILCMLVLINLPMTSVNAEENTNKIKTLHDENCQSCHKSIMSGEPDSIYVRENRRVNNYTALQQQVNRCEKNIGIVWPQKQTDDVITYLNQQFYKFKN